MIKTKCTNCGIEIERYPYQLRNNVNHFCSVNCRFNFQKSNSPKIKCDVCNKEFNRSPTGIKKINYCSNKCLRKGYVGKNVYNYSSLDCACKFCNKVFIKKKCNCDNSDADFCSRECYFEYLKTIAVPRPLAFKIRRTKNMKVWKSTILKRDNYTCTCCGKNRDLQVHHIIHFRNLIYKYNITTLEESLKCKELWDTNNGTTLCVGCHAEEHGDFFWNYADEIKEEVKTR